MRRRPNASRPDAASLVLRLPTVACLGVLTCLTVSCANAGTISITSPHAGDRWAVGSLHYLTWTGDTATPTVRIDCSFDGGRTWRAAINAESGLKAVRLASQPQGPNRLLWRVPAEALSHCRIRIRRAGTPTMNDESQANLNVVPSQEVAYRWTPVNENCAFAPRDGAGALTFKGKMWLLGGWNPLDKVHFPKICNSEVWSTGGWRHLEAGAARRALGGPAHRRLRGPSRAHVDRGRRRQPGPLPERCLEHRGWRELDAGQRQRPLGAAGAALHRWPSTTPSG